jgi:hypothetical protein
MEFIADKSFGGHADRVGFFRVLSYCSFVLWISIIPYFLVFFMDIEPLGLFNLLSFVTLGWMIAVAYKMLISYYKLESRDVFVVIVVGIFTCFILRALLGFLLVGKMYRLFY